MVSNYLFLTITTIYILYSHRYVIPAIHYIRWKALPYPSETNVSNPIKKTRGGEGVRYEPDKPLGKQTTYSPQ